MNKPATLTQAYEAVVSEGFGLGEKAVKITQEQFVKAVRELEQRPNFISITAVTTPAQAKSGEFYPIHKVSQMNGDIGTGYERSVNNARAKEDKEIDFEAKPGWGEHVSKALKEGKNGLSLCILPRPGKRESKYVTRDRETGEFRELSYEERTRYIKDRDDSEKAAESQGLEKAVAFRTVLVANIVGATFSGQEHRMSDVDPEKIEVLKAVGMV